MLNDDLVDTGSSAGGSRKRQPNACNYCRRRKIRCDSAARGGEACTNCMSMKIECRHTALKKKRGPPAGRSAQLKSDNIQALTGSILSSVPYNIPEDQNEMRRILKELASHIRKLEKELAEVRMSPRSDSGSPKSNLGETTKPEIQDDQNDIEDISGTLKQLQFSQSTERYSASNRLMLIKSGIDANRTEETDLNQNVFKRTVFWTVQPWQLTHEPPLEPLLFPPRDLLDHLVNLWFTKAHPYFPLFHRPTFERSVMSGLHYHDRHFGETLLAMCALASRNSDDPRTFTHSSPLSAGFMWMQQVNPVATTFSEAPSLAQVQKLILYIMFMYPTSLPHSSLVLAGFGIRLLQDVGAHRKNSSPTVSTELWKRAFWILNYIDLSFSVNIGRPRATTSDDYDVEFPIECDDEYWEHGDLAFKQPPGKLSQLSYWIHMLKLADILETIRQTMSTVRRSSRSASWPKLEALHRRQQTVLEIDKTLNHWLENIPIQLQWDPQRQDTVLFNQSTTLYLMYYFLRMETYRSSLAASPSSLEICVNAAHSCVLIMEAHRKRDCQSLGPQMLATIANSGIVLLINIWKAKRLSLRININLEMGDVVKCMLQLERFEKRIQLAGRLWDTLFNVILISKLTDEYNLVRGKQNPEPPACETALEIQLDTFSQEQLNLNSTPLTSTTSIAQPGLSSNSFYNPVSNNVTLETSQYGGSTPESFPLDFSTAPQQEWTSSQSMDISLGDWAEYMEGVDEVLRSLQSS